MESRSKETAEWKIVDAKLVASTIDKLESKHMEKISLAMAISLSMKLMYIWEAWQYGSAFNCNPGHSEAEGE